MSDIRGEIYSPPQQNIYKFTWKDKKTGRFVTKYLENTNLKSAEVDLEKTFSVNIVRDKVYVERIPN